MPSWQIVSLQVGLPKAYGDPSSSDPMMRPWTTATFKHPVESRIRLTKLGHEGDGHADLENHGGPDKAVLAYSADHYPWWQHELGRHDFGNGSLGENWSVTGTSEDTVCIGDQYVIGDILVEVSQPRQPCWKQARRWEIPDFVPRIVHANRTGWYLRVLNEGFVAAGDSAKLIARPHPDWTITRANRVLHVDKKDYASALALAALPELSASWKQSLHARVHA